MIKELQITNFKCFQGTSPFEFSTINLLTGINGRGKSSILQAILLVSQSIRSGDKIPEIMINGELIELGNFIDIKNSETPRESDILFMFKFCDPAFETIIRFNANERNPLTGELKDLSIRMSPSDEESDQVKVCATTLEKYFFDQLGKVHYISADRLGPVKFVEKVNLPKFLNVGSRGEFTINILATDDLPLVNDVLYLGKESNSVLQQTQEWLAYILEGARISIEGKDQSSSVLSLLINNKANAYSYKTRNVGFGYSFILPLIVTGLIAKPGEILIIENPEAHLHPRAQARIMELFSKVASCGVQIFIESHSEHILNGIRVASLDPQVNLTAQDVSILYFDEGFKPEKLIPDANGKIANWPTGFFDQQEIALSEIFKLTRK